MKSILILTLVLVLQGCQGPLLKNEGAQTAEPKVIPQEMTVDQWLLLRRELCLQPEEKQRMQLVVLWSTPADQHQKLERLLLASCAPDRTPGLLREALQDFGPAPERTAGQNAFLELLQDVVRSYQVLEDRSRQLQEKLETTIDGIREIETEMEDMRINGGTP